MELDGETTSHVPPLVGVAATAQVGGLTRHTHQEPHVYIDSCATKFTMNNRGCEIEYLPTYARWPHNYAFPPGLNQSILRLSAW